MANENKTQPVEDADVKAFLEAVEDERKRQDAYTVLQLMGDITDEKPVMWGSSIVGFGHHHYKYESGREGDTFLVGFSPRKQNLTLYIGGGFDQYQPLMDTLGKYKTGKGCLYIKKLDDVDQETLKTLIKQSSEYMAKTSAE